MSKFQSRLSFLLMTILVFIGLHFLLLTEVSTGPNTDLSLGWLQLHRHGFEWTIESFRLGALVVVALVSVLVTWVLSKVLRHRTAPTRQLSQ
jgi:NADH:ubiquinone oxidoreductase subunit 5 (subunit L)/multisubunit Na+/H+ antiporter MnhA subunit